MAHLLRRSCVILAFAGVLELQSPLAMAGPQADNSQSANRAKEASIPTNYDPLLDLPPLPKKQLSLLGGMVTRVDRVQDLMTIRVFGGGQTKVAYDTRTQFFRDGNKVSDRELRVEARVHVDTMFEGSRVFAKNVWIVSSTASGVSRGQVMEYVPKTGILTLRDELSSEPVKFLVNEKAIVQNGGDIHYVGDLRPGALISLTFTQQQHGAYSTVQGISLLAQPGSAFSFFGEISYIDLSRRVLAIENQSDKKNYEIDVHGIPQNELSNVHVGTIASISALFDGSQYSARSLSLSQNQGDK